MIKSIILKTLLILGSLIIVIFLGFGYLFSQNDKTLINQIQNYNLNSALKALDERESDKLKLNQNEMEDTVEKISVHSSEFLLNFELQKEGAKAIQIWDSEIGEIFLFAVKENTQVSFVKLLPENLHQYKTIKQNIITLNNNKTEVLGIATFYYD